MQKKLPEKFEQQIRALKAEGDNFQMKHEYMKAIEKYKEAVTLLPQPFEQWKYIWVLLPQIAENYWLNAKFNNSKGGGFQEALDVFREIMKIEGAIGDDSYHFRIGQIRYELGQFEKAKDELLRAYLISQNSGTEYFEDADKKYFELIQPIIDQNKTRTDNDSYQFE